jgi:hypothetical protein
VCGRCIMCWPVLLFHVSIHPQLFTIAWKRVTNDACMCCGPGVSHLYDGGPSQHLNKFELPCHGCCHAMLAACAVEVAKLSSHFCFLTLFVLDEEWETMAAYHSDA